MNSSWIHSSEIGGYVEDVEEHHTGWVCWKELSDFTELTVKRLP